MATRTVWSKGGLKLACDVSDLPAPRPRQVFALPDIAITTTNHSFITLSLEPLTFDVVAVIDSILPSGAGEWWLEWRTEPASRLAPVRVSAGGRAEFHNAKPYAQYTANLMRIDAGSNITRYASTSITTTGAYALGSAADVTAVAAAAAAAQASANTANADLANIASDSLLTPDEKPRVIQDRDVILAEQSGIDAQATAYAITTEKTAYDTAVSALTTYLATLTSPVLWSDIAGNTTIVGATFRGKFADVYTTRQALLNKIYDTARARAASAQSTADAASGAASAAQTAATAAAQAAAYADTLARSSHNLIKNGNSEDANPTGFEAAGVSTYAPNAYTGSSYRAVTSITGQYPDITVGEAPADPGDWFLFSAMVWAMDAGGGAGGGAAVVITFLNSAGTVLSGDAGNIVPVSGSKNYQRSELSLQAPAGTTRVRFLCSSRLMKTGNYALFDCLYACRKISAGMLEADLAVVGVIRSPNYVAGSYGNAPQGFKQSGYAFTTTFEDGSTSSNCFQEIGGDGNFGGYKVQTVNDRVFQRFNRLTNGKFAYSDAPWVGGAWSSTSKTAGTGSLKTSPTGVTLSATSTVTQAFTMPTTTVPTLLALTQGLEYLGDSGAVSGEVKAYILNTNTGTETLVATWTLATYTLAWTDRSVDISSIVNGGGDFALKLVHKVTRDSNTYILNGYIDEISIIA